MDIITYAEVKICRTCESTNELRNLFIELHKNVLKKLKFCVDINVNSIFFVLDFYIFF